MLKLGVTFEQLMDTTLRLEEAEKDSGEEARVEKRGFYLKKKKQFGKSKTSYPSKKAKNSEATFRTSRML